MEKYAVIMAGGAGLRLWPLSREHTPKQFVSLEGNKSMLQQTVERINELIPPDKCYVITNKNHFDLAKVMLHGIIPDSNILLEPLRKNTAACISYATLLLAQKFEKGLICFIPADSYVRNKDEYLKAVHQAYQAAERSNELIVIGVKPTYPATGYGYIQVSSEACMESNDALEVMRFKEKPDIDTAKEYIKSNHYLWNSGMVAGHFNALLDGIHQFLPEHYKKISDVLKHENQADFETILEKAYSELSDISFDNGVLEKSSRLLVVKGSFEWNDIGSLDALSAVFDSDSNNNSIQGKHLGIDTKNSIIYSTDNLVTTIGLDHMIIVAAGDSIIVCQIERAQEVKMIVEKLKETGQIKYT